MKKNLKAYEENEISHSMAHYLLAIHRLKEDNGYARKIDIAKLLGFTKSSVSFAVQGLKKKKLVIEDQNHFLDLSEKAHKEVHSILSTRTLLYYFLKNFLDVSEKKAQIDSCLTEHLFSDDMQNKLFDYMKKISNLKNNKIKSSLLNCDIEFLKKFENFKEFKDGQ